MKLLLGSPGTSPLDLTVIDSGERLKCATQIPREFESSSLENRKTGAIFLVLSLKFTLLCLARGTSTSPQEYTYITET